MGKKNKDNLKEENAELKKRLQQLQATNEKLQASNGDNSFSGILYCLNRIFMTCSLLYIPNYT